MIAVSLLPHRSCMPVHGHLEAIFYPSASALRHAVGVPAPTRCVLQCSSFQRLSAWPDADCPRTEFPCSSSIMVTALVKYRIIHRARLENITVRSDGVARFLREPPHPFPIPIAPHSSRLFTCVFDLISLAGFGARLCLGGWKAWKACVMRWV